MLRGDLVGPEHKFSVELAQVMKVDSPNHDTPVGPLTFDQDTSEYDYILIKLLPLFIDEALVNAF